MVNPDNILIGNTQETLTEYLERTRAEEIAANRARREIELHRENKRRLANKRAMALFESMLTPKQLRDHKEFGHIQVTGATGQKYRIVTAKRQSDGNVHILNKWGKSVTSICAHPTWMDNSEGSVELLPHADGFLTQMLWLQTDDISFLRTARLMGGEWPEEIKRLRGRSIFLRR